VDSFFFFWWGVENDWSLNSGLRTCKAGTAPLEPHLQSFLLPLFEDGSLPNCMPI
jgi:hypothetical protein